MTDVAMGPSEALAALFTPEGKHDPYPLYRALWELGPVVPLGPRMTLVLGYQECCAALREPDLLVTDAAVHQSTGMLEHSSWQCFTKIMMFSNEPDHDRLRRFAREAYSARRVATLRPMAERSCARLLARLSELDTGGPVDLVSEFTFRLPMAVTGELLGIPEADRMGLRAAITACTTAFEPILDLDELRPGDAGMDVLLDYLGGLLRERRAHPADDLISSMVSERDATGALSDEELLASLVMFLIAGAQTPSDLIGNIVRLALEHPEATQDTSAFITESMRFDPAIHALTRSAARDLDLFGTRVAAGSRVLLVLAAANRDPRRFTDPGRFDVTRADNQPLAFGLGTHYCLGAALARMQTEVALPMVLTAFPTMALTRPLSYRDQLVQRGLARMGVTLVETTAQVHATAGRSRRGAVTGDLAESTVAYSSIL
ncbi:cytochrome P450 [Saccharopolyspora hattusasensis]|uniref:cytochrome P450 n=1 Tax=Saccharopolyspora hattusasensis TaxID=1128679 RepID=UPI003D95A1E0